MKELINGDIKNIENKKTMCFDEFMECNGEWIKSVLEYEINDIIKLEYSSNKWEYFIVSADGDNKILRKRK